ncbi:hypothetical protein B0H19DRAFT_1302792 [Mycena capillaripes]|nr:hypothetical protein B0H19DRAFT_1302792 [Mycena capillaripes]
MRFASAVRINGALLPVLFASAKNILVLVGDNNQLAFSPSSVSAALGDNAVFTFMSKNHSVTQSSFANPCQNLPLSPGLESGFQFIADPAATMLFPQWSFNITDVVPLWFFCAQTTHCQEVGMVFSINANELGSETFAAFQARAMAAALSTSSAVSSPASSGASSTASSTALTSSTTVTPSNTDSPVVIKKMNLAGPIRKLADGEKKLSTAQQMGVIQQEIRDLTEQAAASGLGEEGSTGRPNSTNAQVLDAIRMLGGQVQALEQQLQGIGQARADEPPQYTAGPSS